MRLTCPLEAQGTATKATALHRRLEPRGVSEESKAAADRPAVGPPRPTTGAEAQPDSRRYFIPPLSLSIAPRAASTRG